MASGRLVFSNWMPALDADGVPIPNAQMFFYVNRTTTLAVVYSDEALTVPLANPVLADSSGQFPPVWADITLLFSASVASTTLGQFDTIDDLAPSSTIGGDDLTKANVTLSNVDISAEATIKRLDVVNDDGSEPGVTEALAAGSSFGALSVIGAAEAAPYDPDPDKFQDVSRNIIKLATKGNETTDINLRTGGPGGAAVTNRLIVAGNQFGQNNNLCQLVVMSSPPELEEVNNNPGDIDLGTPRAAVFGILGGPGIGNYPDIDAVSAFIRQYGTRPVPYAVASYTATTVTFVDPLPDTVSVPVTSSLQTTHTPNWFRAVVTAVSEDRKTLTVYGWAKQKALTDPAFFETPTGTAACYVNVFTKGFGTNFPVELLGPIYERDDMGALVWRLGGTIVAAGTPGATLTEEKPANFQDIMCVGEVSAVNTKGLIDYVGTLVVNDPETGAPYHIDATVGCKNFTFGWDVVQTGSYIDPTTGELERGYGGFGMRARGQWTVGYESQDNKDYGFRVQRSFNSPDVAGFAYEAGNEFNQKTAFLVAPNKDQHWMVDARGNMQIGSKTINYGGQSILWFTAGNANPDATLIVSGGDGSTSQLATFQWFAGAHNFQGGDGTTQFRVGYVPGATDYIEARGVTGGPQIRVMSPNTNSNLLLTPKGAAGVLNFDYLGAGVPAFAPGSFTADRVIPVETPNGRMYIPARASLW